MVLGYASFIEVAGKLLVAVGRATPKTEAPTMCSHRILCKFCPPVMLFLPYTHSITPPKHKI